MPKVVLQDWEIDQIFINNKFNLIYPLSNCPIDSITRTVHVPRAWCYCPCPYPESKCGFRYGSSVVAGCYHFDYSTNETSEFILPCDESHHKMELHSPDDLPVKACRIHLKILGSTITTIGDLTLKQCKDFGQPICTHDLLCTQYDNHACGGCVSTLQQAKHWFCERLRTMYPDVKVSDKLPVIVFDIEPIFDEGA